MIVEWNGTFDGAQMLWLLLAAILLLLVLLPALLVVFSRGRLLQLQLNPEQWLTGAAVHVTLWLLLLHSLAFGPSLGTTPSGPEAEAPRPMSEMMRDAANQQDIRPFFGRGGFVGDLHFAGFSQLEAQGDPGEPLFASRRPHHSVSLSAFIVLQMAIYLCAVGGVSAAVATTGTSAGKVLAFSTAWGVLVYVPIAHWVWGEGWLGIRHALDTGGSLFLLLTCCSVIAAGFAADHTLASDDQAPAGIRLQQICTGLLWPGFAVLSCSLQVPSAPLRAMMLLNLLAAACGGYSCSTLLRMTFSAGNCRPVHGLLTGMAATAAGAMLYDPMTALICGAGGTAAALVCCDPLQKRTTLQTLQLPMYLAASAFVGMLLPGLLAGSSNGVFHWDKTPVESLIHGSPQLLVIQTLAAGTTAGWSTAITLLLKRMVLQPPMK
ncbi:MAG: hypothetical protein ACKO3T_14820 [Planctomycetaceae bacterium]